MFNYRTITSIFLLLLAAYTTFGQNGSCYNLLKDGVFDKSKIINKNNYSSKFKYGFCSYLKTARESGAEGKFSATVPVEDIPVDFSFGSSSKERQSYEQQYCSNQEQEIDSKQLYTVMTSIANPDLIKGYNECLGQPGLKSEIIGTEKKRFIIMVRWNTFPGVSTVEVADFDTGGAKCSNFLKVGSIINSLWTTIQCERVGNEPFDISLNVKDPKRTDIGGMGSTSESIDAYTPKRIISYPLSISVNGRENSIVKNWLNTNITVSSGQILVVSAKGSVDLDIGNSKDDYVKSTPDGAILKEFWGQCKEAKCGLLIGKIGEDGPLFEIGGYRNINATRSGILYLAVVDNNWDNNRGEYNVEISIK